MPVYSYALLAEKYGEQILSLIEKNRTVIIKGPTGCGKSTYIPVLLKDKKMAIIEPRRIAVTSLYNILESKIPNIGYKMRFNQVRNENTNAMIYTDGSFLNSISNLEYDYIILDEVHERSLRTDLILALLKKCFHKKLILMSATLDTSKLENFFNAVTFSIPGEGYPVQVNYLDAPTTDYISETYLCVKKILKTREKNEKKDILVFLPGEDDINETDKLLKKIPSIKTYKVHSRMNDSEQQRIYEQSDLTRVILSTNICETSLTIPNIKYVIDSGLVKSKVFDRISYLGILPISIESSIQRMGRCNRLGPGVCYKLYTSSQKFSKNIPEIQKSDLTTFILNIINLKKNLLTFEFIDYPPVKNIYHAINFLYKKNCISISYKNQKIDDLQSFDDKYKKVIDFVDQSEMARDISFKITSYGRRLACHPFDVHLAHFYENCVTNGVGYYGSVLVSMMSQENYNFLNYKTEKNTDIEKLIEIFELFKDSNDKMGFCVKNGLPYKGMMTADKMFNCLNKQKDGDIDNVQRIFSKCFDHNLAIRNPDGSYSISNLEKNIYVHPSSGFFKRRDKKIVFLDIFWNTKVYGRIIGKYFE